MEKTAIIVFLFLSIMFTAMAVYASSNDITFVKTVYGVVDGVGVEYKEMNLEAIEELGAVAVRDFQNFFGVIQNGVKTLGDLWDKVIDFFSFDWWPW